MPELLLLRPQIPEVEGIRFDLYWQALHHLDAVASEAIDLGRVVSEHGGSSHAEVEEHLGGDAIVARVIGQTEGQVGLHGVKTLLLKRVGGDLVGEPYAASLLPEVEETPRPCSRRSRMLSSS